MKELQKLIGIVTKKKLALLDVPGKSKDEKINQLYLAICDGKVNNHTEAAQLLFGKSERNQAYQKLQDKLKSQLIDMLLLIDVNQAVNEDAERAYQECWRLATAAMLLVRSGIIPQSVEYADRALRMAMTFEYADIVVYLTKPYRKLAATFLGNEEKFEYYHQLYLKYSSRIQLEARVAEKYEQLMVRAVQPNAQKADLGDMGLRLFQELKPLLEQYDYLVIHRYVRFIQITYLLNKGAFGELIEACNSALVFFDTKPMNVRSTQLGFVSAKLLACMQLKQLEEGMAALAEANKLIEDPAKSSFFQLQELGLLLCFHTEAYQQAADLLSTTLSNTAIRQQACVQQRQWKVYQAYIIYLVAHKKVELLPDESFALSINLRKFLKNIPPFNKAERSANVPILIIQSLLLITKQRYQEAQLTLNMLQKYASQYLRQDENFRSNCFINMLAQLSLAGFHRAASIRYADKYWKKLKSLPIELSNQAAEIEIIPYEELWKMMLDTLVMKRIKLKKIPRERTQAS